VAARRKAVVLLAKAHQYVAHQRRTFHHKEAHKLIQQYGVIYYARLRVRTLVKSHSLAEGISDAGWFHCLGILTFKAAEAGKRVHAVNPACTSQTRSGPNRGRVVWKGLFVRWHRCPDC
jgi:putative transposase